MNETWQSRIPSADTEPADAQPSRIRTAAEAELSRRTVIRSVAALGMTLGVTVLGWVAPGASRRAEAAVGSYWGNCSTYSYDDMLCYPQVYSNAYCGADGWFRWGSYNGYRWEPITNCNSRNAWIWDTGSVGWRCADGNRYGGSGSGTFLICNAVAYRH